jgi:FkbM family methyltransferase
MHHLRIVAADFRGLCNVCGLWVAVRWLLGVIWHFGACRRVGNLQPADAVIGDGPIAVRQGKARAMITCYRVLSGVREIWVRDVYLGRGFLSIAPDGVVVDLGANMGAFTLLALAHGANVRVVAVEADPVECGRFEKNLALNGWADRTKIVRAFVGGRTQFQVDLAATGRTAAVPTIDPAQLLAMAGGQIDLLKCDIEGSEFELFASAGPLLAACRQIAMELHPDAGDPTQVIELLRSNGFEVRHGTHGPTVLAQARRAAPVTRR